MLLNPDTRLLIGSQIDTSEEVLVLIPDHIQRIEVLHEALAKAGALRRTQTFGSVRKIALIDASFADEQARCEIGLRALQSFRVRVVGQENLGSGVGHKVRHFYLFLLYQIINYKVF